MPRFDLLRFEQYLNMVVQYSRGCPFVCEFCDIIERFGRVPRTKTTEQMLTELEALYRMGYRGHVDFVDDNFIGNKKALKAFLPELKEWLEAHDYPFQFSTEASINLADDPRLLELMKETNFFTIFVGIESPDTETLVHAQKKQNTRRSIAASIYKIYHAGIFVNAGFIVGFDTEKASVADEMIQCIEESAIAVCMVSMLYALPNTQLSRRLLKEERLFLWREGINPDEEGDQCTAGLNFETSRPRQEILRDYKTILERIYDPRAYFGRVRRVARELDPPKRRLRIAFKRHAREWIACARLLWRMGAKNPEMRAPFWSALLDCVIHNPRALPHFFSLMAIYLHLGPFAKYVISRLDQKISSIDRGEWNSPRPLSSPVAEHHGYQTETPPGTIAAALAARNPHP